MFVNLIIALSNWILLLLFLFIQGAVPGNGMMKLVQFNICTTNKCVCFHHCSCIQSKGQAQCSGAPVTAGTTSMFNYITVQLQGVGRTMAHKEMCVGERQDSCV